MSADGFRRCLSERGNVLFWTWPLRSNSLALPHRLDRPPHGLDATLHEGSSPPKSEKTNSRPRQDEDGGRGGETGGQKDGGGMAANLLPTSQPGWLLQPRRPKSRHPVTMETAADIPESPTNLSRKNPKKLSWNIKVVNQLFIFQQ